MPEFVHYEVTDRVAVLTIDNPPVNALGAGVWEAIDQGVARANGDAAVDAIALIGAGTAIYTGQRQRRAPPSSRVRPNPLRRGMIRPTTTSIRTVRRGASRPSPSEP